MPAEGPLSAPPPVPVPNARAGAHRRRHRRGQGRAQQQRDTGGVANSLKLLPGSSMFCREANEAHLALLSTLPAHMVTSAGIATGLCLQPESEQQQVQNEKMIREFKTIPCNLEGTMSSHDHRCCPFFHSERDRRRIVLSEGECLYIAEPCDEQFDDQRICSRNDSCGFCHSTAELLYHPDFFRKRLCHQAKRCPRGRFCAFAHSRQELLVPHFTEQEELEPTEDFIAWRFKTQWCPIGGPHDWENCVYAHTYRDWRRVPTLGYSSRPCPHWVQSVTSGSAELMYVDRCPRNMACPLAHGAKEQLYHPQFYKTSPCSEANCKRGALCAFTHGAHDMRRPRCEDPIPNSVREPILQAVELLGRSQPTFWSPPRYHALEEPPRSSGSGQPKGRSRGGSISSLQQKESARWNDGQANPSALLGTDAPLLPPALPCIASGGADGGPSDPTGYSAFGVPPSYHLCQWVPMGSEPSTNLVPPPIGYGQVMDPSWEYRWGGYAPWVCNPYMQACISPSSMQAPLPYLLPPPLPDSQENAAHAEQDTRGTSKEFAISPHSLESLCLSADSDISPVGMLPDLSGALHLNGMPPWPAIDEEAFWSRQGRHARKGHEGLRTPSSLGSPPLSAAPTEAPSPRPIEVESGAGSDCRSSDDASAPQMREPMCVQAKNIIVSDVIMQELPCLDVTAFATTPICAPIVIDTELDNTMLALAEAPCPASPAR